jgi:hypothetical protein
MASLMKAPEYRERGPDEPESADNGDFQIQLLI